jgi:hypothetical protein
MWWGAHWCCWFFSGTPWYGESGIGFTFHFFNPRPLLHCEGLKDYLHRLFPHNLLSQKVHGHLLNKGNPSLLEARGTLSNFLNRGSFLQSFPISSDLGII